MSKTYQEIIKHQKILFVHFGELGWEIMRFSGVIHKIKNDFPKKHIVVCSRQDRYDLYHNVADEFIDMPLNGYVPNGYHLDCPTKIKEDFLKQLKKKYPNHFIVDSSPWQLNRNIFKWNNMLFNYTPRSENKNIINEQINGSIKASITISPRHRDDIKLRNWGKSNWRNLYQSLVLTEKYNIFITGKSPDYILPILNKHKFIILEDLVESNTNTSLIGLTIEAIKASKLTIGSQSSIPLLSQLLKTPILSWGNEKKRHEKDENIFNTRTTFIEDKDYTTRPTIIFDNIKIMTNIKSNPIIIKSDKKLTIGVIGNFSDSYSTNIRIADAFKRRKDISSVYTYDFKESMGRKITEIFSQLNNLGDKCDYVIICKGGKIPPRAIQQLANRCKVYLHFMDYTKTLKGFPNIIEFSKSCHYRSSTGYGIAKDWENIINLPVYHIPDAGDPRTYYPIKSEKLYDITFIGSRTPERLSLFNTLRSFKFNVVFFGPGFNKWVDPSEFNTICNKSKIVLNLSRGGHEGYTSVRLWNLLCTGSMVITNPIPNMTKRLCLEESNHLITYKHIVDIKNKIEYYLENEEKRNEIGKEGLRWVKNNRTWDHFADDILNIMNNEEPVKLKIISARAT